MPPRYVYWTIIVGGQPTAFRAATRDELLPTLKQLQSKQPDAVMMWFARGKLWPSEEAAAMALRMDRQGTGRERRGSDWRPGGQHKDPRDRFKVPRDVKRQRFASRLRRDRVEEPQGHTPGGPKDQRPAGNRPFRPREDRPVGDRPSGPAENRPRENRPSRPRESRPAEEGPLRPKGPRGFAKPGFKKPGGGGNPRGGGGGGRGPR